MRSPPSMQQRVTGSSRCTCGFRNATIALQSRGGVQGMPSRGRRPRRRAPSRWRKILWRTERGRPVGAMVAAAPVAAGPSVLMAAVTPMTAAAFRTPARD
jgi:hypothetical protein